MRFLPVSSVFNSVCLLAVRLDKRVYSAKHLALLQSWDCHLQFRCRCTSFGPFFFELSGFRVLGVLNKKTRNTWLKRFYAYTYFIVRFLRTRIFNNHSNKNRYRIKWKLPWSLLRRSLSYSKWNLSMNISLQHKRHVERNTSTYIRGHHGLLFKIENATLFWKIYITFYWIVNA